MSCGAALWRRLPDQELRLLVNNWRQLPGHVSESLWKFNQLNSNAGKYFFSLKKNVFFYI